MKSSSRILYTGDPDRKPDHPHPDSPPAEPYLAAPELVKAVNLAIYLKRPLLLEGEAGCGKTRLARAVAHELGLPFYPWYVRSTSKAQEGLYTYDAVLRLHDVQTRQVEAADPGETGAVRRDPRNPQDYRRFGPLGKAFQQRDCPAVVLIDEIDKADMDFPNDLLAVLDEWSFEVPETGEPPIQAVADCRPIVIITSNKEKGNLPAPFLRRCIYYFIEFPNDPERLKQIVEVHYQQQGQPGPAAELAQPAVQRFLELRNEGGLYKKPGTSELLDWIEALHGFAGAGGGAQPDLGAGQPLPYPELLLKLRADWQKFVPAK